jgi:predicted AlkP superfamily pyrophosphatase or phosphodiesterase
VPRPSPDVAITGGDIVTVSPEDECLQGGDEIQSDVARKRRREMAQSLNFIVDTSKRPKHVILIGLDGMRYDYLEHYPMPHIKSLIENGVSFRNAITSNFPASTAPGFASLSTGVVSREHGIYASEEWYDKRVGKLRYFFDDQEGRLDLKVPTLCDAVKAVNHDAKVVSVSTKDRPALLLAGRNADILVYSYRRRKATKEEVSQGRARVAVSGAGVHEDYYCWAERPNHQLPPYLKDRRLARNVDWKGAGFHHPNIDVRYTPGVDTFTMGAALDIIRNEQPYLTFVAMESVDHDAQAYSMDSPETMVALDVIDTEIGHLIELLKEMDWYDDTLIVISADHAMAAKPKCVSVMDELEKKGHHDIIENILYILTGESGGLYLEDVSPGSVKKTIEIIQDIPYIKGAWYKNDSNAPWFIKRAASERTPDIFIVPHADAVTVPAGYESPIYLYGHGCPYPADANIIMVFSGSGVKKLGSVGERLDLSSHRLLTGDEVENLPEQIDVAPTMKHIMGLPVFPEEDG